MNKVQLQKKRNDIRRLFKHSSGIHVGCIRINTGNTYEHERKKFEICWLLQSNGQHFITEAEFENGLRCDIINLNTGRVIEVVQSESKKSIEQKRRKYPLSIEVVEVKE